MRYEHAVLAFLITKHGDLRVASAKINQCLRKTLKLRSNSETDLLRGDFEFFLPQVRPYWDETWKVEDYSQVVFSNNYESKCFDKCIANIKIPIEFLPSITAEWPSVSLQLGLDMLIGDNEGLLELQLFNHIRIQDSRELQQAKALTDCFENFCGITHLATQPISETKHVKFKHKQYTVSRSKGLTGFADPSDISINTDADASEELQSWFRQCKKEFCSILGDPELVQIRFSCVPSLTREVAKTATQVAPRWDMHFFSAYRKNFDPFTRPIKVKNEIMYPVVRKVSEPIENDFFLDLQVTVYHGLQESYLLLHTQRDQKFLREISDEAGLEISEFGTKDYHGLEGLKI